MLDMMRLANRLGVEFAFPIQTVHLYKQEQGVQYFSAESPDSMADRRAKAFEPFMIWLPTSPGKLKSPDRWNTNTVQLN